MPTRSRLMKGGAISVAALIAFALVVPAVVSQAVSAPGDPTEHVDLRPANELSEAFRAVAKKLKPSVVSIRSVKTVQTTSGVAPNMQGIPEEFKRFFPELEERQFGPQNRAPRRRQATGTGSGVIVSKDGYIVTNNHVVEGAEEVEVTLSSGKNYNAEIVGTDDKTDVAVIKIDAANLTPAAFGNSDALEVGDWVIAVGSPFGLTQTVTAGIVSATGRADVGVADYEDFIQTDAAINPGNSGGPLLNLRGEIVGINTAIASRSGSYSGIGFAIPSRMVKRIHDDLKVDGKIERGRIGAAIQTLTDDLAQTFDYDGRGVLVGEVVDDSPAEQAGLKTGDIVTQYAGEPVVTANQLRNRVAATKPGTKTELQIIRNGKDKTLPITVGRLEETESAIAIPADSDADGTKLDLGLTVEEPTNALAKKYGFPRNTSGVVITDIDVDSPAASLGLRPGDVILQVNNDVVDSVETFADLMTADTLSNGVRVLVQRGGLKIFLFLQVD